MFEGKGNSGSAGQGVAGVGQSEERVLRAASVFILLRLIIDWGRWPTEVIVLLGSHCQPAGLRGRRKAKPQDGPVARPPRHQHDEVLRGVQ